MDGTSTPTPVTAGMPDAIRATAGRDAAALRRARFDETLQSLYHFAIDRCLAANLERWWDCSFIFHPKVESSISIQALRGFCTWHVLRGAGDVWAFEKIYEVLRDDLGIAESDVDSFSRELATHIVVELEKLRHIEPPTADKQPLVLSALVVGEESIDTFLNYCLPSLQTASNIGALCRDRAPLLMVRTLAQDAVRIAEHPAVRALGIPVVVDVFPAGLIAQVKDWYCYQLACSLQGLHLSYAKAIDADFHLLETDAIYADAYFENVLRLAKGGASTILTTLPGAPKSDMSQALQVHRAEDTLSIDARELATLALSNADPLTRQSLVSRQKPGAQVPKHLTLMWETEDKLTIHSACHTIAYLDHSEIAQVPWRYFVALEGELSSFLPVDCEPYFPTAADHIVGIKLSGTQDAGFRFPATSAAEYAKHFWEHADQKQAEHFQQAVQLPLDRNRSQVGRIGTNAEIEATTQTLFTTLRNSSALADSKKLLTVLGALSVYEASRYGQRNMSRVFQEAKSLFEFQTIDKASMPHEDRHYVMRYLKNFDLLREALSFADNADPLSAFEAKCITVNLALNEVNQAIARKVRANAGDRGISVIGSIVWGSAYIARYFDYHIASLLAPGNIPALARDRLVVVSVVTTESGRRLIENHPLYPALCRHATLHFTCFPEELICEQREIGSNFYAFYGMLDHQNIFFAKYLDADLYLLPVDCVFSNDSLTNLNDYLQQGADCCGATCIESDEGPFLNTINRHAPRSDILDIGAAELFEIADSTASDRFKSILMVPENDRFSMHPRWLVWPVRGGYTIHSLFIHPIAISARALRRPFRPNYENVDYALIPRLLQNVGQMHLITDTRKVAISHFGVADGREEYCGSGFCLGEFLGVHRHDYAIHRDMFHTAQFIPCETSEYAPSDKYEAEIAAVLSALERPEFNVGPPAPVAPKAQTQRTIS